MILFPIAMSTSLDNDHINMHLISPQEAFHEPVSAIVLDANDKHLAASLSKQSQAPMFTVGFSFPNAISISPDEFSIDVIQKAAAEYESSLLPPFVSALIRYTDGDQTSFATPGHHGGEFFRQTPGGRLFYQFFGSHLFHADISSSDAYMGDMLTHEGFAYDAEQHAAEVFHADRTYFVLNGTSSANKVCTNALLVPGDLVLFDRNNHKSVHHGALIQAGATPVYLEGTRNAYGFIGGIPAAVLDPELLRRRACEVSPQAAEKERPYRLAVFQLGTYDGILYNAADIVKRIGHLCDYILFDCAWVGYEQFIPAFADISPLRLALTEDSPGILVTQSVHKQLAGLAQTSQIHKKDNHLQDQTRYVTHEQFNNAFLLHASTSPNYPLFASLDMNASIHQSPQGEELWQRTVRRTVDTKKEMLRRLRYFRPFVPDQVDGRRWQDIPTEEILSHRRYFAIVPQADWHGFDGFEENQYCLDPCKILVYTPGIRISDWQYEDFGIPANIVSKYLQQRQMTPEKCDLNSLLFLVTPAESTAKLERLIDLLADLETAIDEDRPLHEVLPRIAAAYPEKYRDYTIRRLCREMHDFYRQRGINRLQQALFQEKTLPAVACSAKAATEALTAGRYELLPIADCLDRVALEGALPYPPGILTIVPGERWTPTVCQYFAALEEGMNLLPGFAPEIQGVHHRHENGKLRLYAHVLQE